MINRESSVFLNTDFFKYPLQFYLFFNISSYFSQFHNFFYFCQHFYDHIYSIFCNLYISVFICTRPSVRYVSIDASAFFNIDLVASFLMTFIYHINRTTTSNYNLFPDT